MRWDNADAGSQHAMNTQHISPGQHSDHPTVRLTATTLCCAVVELGVQINLALPVRVRAGVRVRVRVRVSSAVLLTSAACAAAAGNSEHILLVQAYLRCCLWVRSYGVPRTHFPCPCVCALPSCVCVLPEWHRVCHGPCRMCHGPYRGAVLTIVVASCVWLLCGP